MPDSFDARLVVVISSHALVYLEESMRVFERQHHCESASTHVATGHVPFGVADH